MVSRQASGPTDVRTSVGPDAWRETMHPDKLTSEPVDNPYQYSDFHHAGG